MSGEGLLIDPNKFSASIINFSLDIARGEGNFSFRECLRVKRRKKKKKTINIGEKVKFSKFSINY